MKTNRSTLVVKLPEKLSQLEARVFCRELRPILTADRPRLVFDLSELREIDSAGVDVLVDSLERVVQNDGDLKLAALTPQAAVILQLTRVDRLFEIYGTTAQAVESFHGFPIHSALDNPESWHASSFSAGQVHSDQLAG
ncbi:MAG: STAS domain-containing protein [Acidobacteria bacterium]|jgi:anti-sigma B factor antagonist|nr:STAS domain-containing protein [Acidobacteriota bacterium]